MTRDEFKEYLLDALTEINRHAEEGARIIGEIKKAVDPFSWGRDRDERYEITYYHSAFLETVALIKQKFSNAEICSSTLLGMIASSDHTLGRLQVDAAFELAQIIESKSPDAPAIDQTIEGRREYFAQVVGLMCDDIGIDENGRPTGVATLESIGGTTYRTVEAELDADQFEIAAKQLLSGGKVAFTARCCGGAKRAKLYEIEDFRGLSDA